MTVSHIHATVKQLHHEKKGVKMKFSDKTLTILRNFSAINQSIILKKGNVLKTISPQKTVMASATIDEEIPSDAVIYDLSRLLAVYALYDDADISFEQKNLIISEKNRKTRYFFADQSMVIAPPDKEISIPTPDVTVNINLEDLKSVLKACGVLQQPEMAFIGKDGKCVISTYDSQNPTADNFQIELGDTEDNFVLIIKLENAKIIPSNYTVSLSSKGISMFESETMKYFIAIESKSTFNKG